MSPESKIFILKKLMDVFVFSLGVFIVAVETQLEAQKHTSIEFCIICRNILCIILPYDAQV